MHSSRSISPASRAETFERDRISQDSLSDEHEVIQTARQVSIPKPSLVDKQRRVIWENSIPMIPFHLFIPLAFFPYFLGLWVPWRYLLSVGGHQGETRHNADRSIGAICGWKSIVCPRFPLFIDPIGMGFSIGDQIAVSSLERMVAIDGERSIDTGREAEVRFRWM